MLPLNLINVQLKTKEGESLQLVTYVYWALLIQSCLGLAVALSNVELLNTRYVKKIFGSHGNIAACSKVVVYCYLPLSTLQFTLYNSTASARLLYYPIFAAEVFLLLDS